MIHDIQWSCHRDWEWEYFCLQKLYENIWLVNNLTQQTQYFTSSNYNFDEMKFDFHQFWRLRFAQTNFSRENLRQQTEKIIN